MKKSRFELPKKEYRKLVLLVFQRDNYKCRFCGSREQLEPHHIVFRSHGGGDYSWNLLTLCHTCHQQGVHQRNLLILCATGTVGMPVNADEGVVIVAIGGWKPRRKK